MSWHKGTTTGYKDLLDHILAYCTQNVVDTYSVAAAGTGYILGEVLSLVGGTATYVAKFRVYKLGVRLAAIQAGGTGYTVSDVLTVVGGDGTAATLTVDSVTAGVIDGVSVQTAGTYKTLPTNPVAVTGGTGNDDATFNLTIDEATSIKVDNAGAYTANPSTPAITTSDGAGTGCTVTNTMTTGNGWTTMRNATPGGEKEIILRGDGSGTDEIYVGILSYNVNDAYNWELGGFTGYNSGADWADQPDLQPGRAALLEHGAFVPLSSTTFDYWISISSYRIMGACKVGSAYPNFHVGLLNPFATDAEMPYPLWICGCTDQYDLKFSETAIHYSGLTDPITDSTVYPNAGISFFRMASGEWKIFANSYSSGGVQPRTALWTQVVLPCGSITHSYPTSPSDKWYASWPWTYLIPNTGNPGLVTYELRPTPDDDGDRLLFPVQLAHSLLGANNLFIGEVDGLFWFSAVGTVTTEQTIEIGDDIYRIFQNCNRSEDFSFLCIKEQ